MDGTRATEDGLPDALIVDWEGVVTVGVDAELVDVEGWPAGALGAATGAGGVPGPPLDAWEFVDAVRRQAGMALGDTARIDPVYAYEALASADPSGAAALAVRLLRRASVGGTAAPEAAGGEAEAAVRWLRAALPALPTMAAVLRRVRAAGHRTALLTNGHGDDYPRAGWAALFDAVVTSGQTGLHKPRPEAYRLVAERLGVPPARCAFVDDSPANVSGARRAGMVGVLYRSLPQTVGELVALGLYPERPGLTEGPEGPEERV
ncbi:HAD family hydrolase [Allostreptomyces psammosilenae]|uniref:HAD superfamily hydrolase (TIGR01509 family) n=1 Tax=Allostreptomyces psammosilenae TaxID=1892865 RepID=A0A852ZWW5_9ACTN|nr:HAD-IA family hydrolase [Allostreptomyces psammosilenae]NYI06187.1 HAD superfamily hydrolase (TIGR01509 family) [Allostreptomyces psammosilenae]